MEAHLEIFKKISNSDVDAYEFLFREYYNFLCSYAFSIIKEKHISEEIVEDFFVELWVNRANIEITQSVRAYFLNSIHNRSLNYLLREKRKYVSADDISHLIEKENRTDDKLITPEIPNLLLNELENELANAIDRLPQKCKEIFLLSRYKKLSYEEISLKLNISVNTVKTQIKIALSKLKNDVKGYLTVITIFFLKI